MRMRMTIDLLVSTSGDLVSVDGSLVLPGVVAHSNPNPKRQDVWLTHVSSGLPLLMGAALEHLSTLVAALSVLRWDVPADDIYASAPHRACVQEALHMVTRSEKQEKRLATQLKGKRSPASGAGIGLKRDVRTKRLLIEAKTTGQASYYAKVTEISLLTKQAFREGRTPAFIVQVRDHEEVVLMPEDEVYSFTGEDPAEATRTGEVNATIAISEDLVREVIDGVVVRYVVEGTPYLLLGYEAFLTMVKP